MQRVLAAMRESLRVTGRARRHAGRRWVDTSEAAAARSPVTLSADGVGRSAYPGPVEAALRRLEPLRVERLDRVGGARDDPLGVLVRLEVGEHPVGERAAVAAAGPADADAEPQELLRPEVPGDRARPLWPASPPPSRAWSRPGSRSLSSWTTRTASGSSL